MADVLDPAAQASIEMPDGVVLTGMGGDVDAITEQVETRYDELHPEPVAEPAKAAAVAAAVIAEPEKPRTRGQKRFDELTAQREAEKRRADVAEAKAKELEAKLAPVAEPAKPAAIAQPLAAVAATTRAKPVDTEIGTKYPDYAAYTEALADWVADGKIEKLRADLDAESKHRIEVDSASRNRSMGIQSAYATGRSVYSDFDAVLKTVDDIGVPPEYLDAILRVPDPAHVIYGLAKDRDAFQRILKITDALQFGLEISKFLPRAAVASPASTTPVVRTTNAPAPLQPVGAGTRTTSPSIEEAATESQEAYRRARGLRAVR